MAPQAKRAGVGLAIGLGVVAFLFGGTQLPAPTSSILQAGLLIGALALSFQVVYGFLGELSLGHAALFGAGAYAYSIVAVDLSPFVAIALGAVAGGLLGAAVALITMRLGGVYFAVVTFALASIAAIVVRATEALGRNEGIIGVESLPTPDGWLRPQVQFLALGVTFFGFILLVWLARRTRFGMTLEMARSDHGLALSQGINAAALRVMVTILSGILAGIAGALFAQNARFVSPEVFGLYYIITPLSVVAVGGRRHTLGVIPGVLIVVLLPRFLGLSPIVNAALGALLLVAAVLIFPRGVAGAIESAWHAARGRLRGGGRDGNGPASPAAQEAKVIS